MGQGHEAKKAALLESSPEFKNLAHEHRIWDVKLKEYDRKFYLLPA